LAQEAEEVDPLLSDGVELDLGAVLAKPVQQPARLANEVRVERAGQTAVRREQHDRRAPHRLRTAQERVALTQFGVQQARDDRRQLLRVRTRGSHAVRGALELRCRDHLHRARDLARVLDGADAPADLPNLRHDQAPTAAGVASCAANVSLYSRIAATSCCSVSSDRSFVVRIASPTCGYRSRMKSWKPASQARIRSTGTSSR